MVVINNKELWTQIMLQLLEEHGNSMNANQLIDETDRRYKEKCCSSISR